MLTTARAGYTLLELLLVLVLGGIVLGIASTMGIRLQRGLGAESARFAIDEQLAGGAEVLPIDLRGLSPRAGDIAMPGTRDTALEIRATIANAVVCASSSHTVTLSWYRGSAGQVSAVRAAPGDTLWLLEDHDSGERWHAAAITAIRPVAGVCGAVETSADQVIDRSHLWGVDVRDSGIVQRGAVVRITRPERFSFYRAGDGEWYLGLRTWNSSAAVFNGVQPIGGPYRSPTAPHGVRLTYFDSTGASLTPTPSDAPRVARIEALLTADRAGRGTGAAAIESVTVVVGLRNRNE